MATRVNTRFVLTLSAVLVSLTLAVGAFWFIFVYRNAARLVQWGNEYYAEEQYKEAAEMYSKAVSREQNDVRLLYKWADASSKVICTNSTEVRRYLGDMVRAYNQCIVLQPANPEHVQNLMDIFLTMARDVGDSRWWQDMYDMSKRILDNQPRNNLAQRYHAMATVNIMRATAMEAAEREKARETLTDLYGQDPENSDIAHALAQWYLVQSKDFSGPTVEQSVRDQYQQMADQISRESLQVDPHNPRRQLNRAQILVGLDKNDEAAELIDRLEQAILTTGGDPAIIRKVAVLLTRVDKTPVNNPGLPDTTRGVERASRLVEAALKQHPTDIRLKTQLALLKRMQADMDGARKLFQEIAGSDVHATAMNANLEAELKRRAGFEQASLMIAEAERLTDSDVREARLVDAENLINSFKEEAGQNDPGILLLEGKVQMVRGNWLEASSKLDQACDLYHDSEFESVYLSGVARKQSNQLGAAVARFKRAIELRPDYFKVRYDLARLQIQLNRLPEASKNIKFLQENNPDDVQTRLLYAQYLDKAGKTDEAIKLIKSIDASDNPDLLILLAKLYVTQDKKDTAIQMLETYFQRDPTEPRILLQLVRLAPNHEMAQQYIETARNAGMTDRGVKIAEAQIASEQDPRAALGIVEDPFARALGLFALDLRSGDIDKATQDLAKAIEINPDDPKVLDSRFQLAVVKQDWKEMEDAVKLAEENNADLAQGLFFRGRLELLKGDIHRAVSTLAEAVNRRPVYSDGHRILGEAQLAMGYVRDAAQSFNTAILQNPRNARAQIGLGKTLHIQNQSDQALQHFRKASEIAPNNRYILQTTLAYEERYGDQQQALKKRLELADKMPQFIDNQRALALLQSRMDKPDQALQTINQVIQKEGMNWDNARTKAGILYANGDTDAGRSLLQQYLNNLGDKARAQDWILMARYLRSMGDINASLAAYRVGMRFDDPKVALARRALAGMLTELKQFDKALEQYDQLRKMLPDDVNIATDRIRTLISMDQLNQADQALEKAISAFGQRTPLLLLKSLTLRSRMIKALKKGQRGKYDELRSETLAILNRAIEADKTNADAYLRRAELYAQNPETLTRSIDDAKRALELNPNHASARMLLAALYHRENDTDAAIRELQTLLASDEKNIPAREQLIKILIADHRIEPLQQILADSVELFPRDHRWWLYKALVAQTLELNKDKAIDDYRKAFELAPPNVNAVVLEELVRLMLDAGRTDDALQLIDEQTEIVSGRPMLQAMRGRALALKGQTEAATNLFASLIPSCSSIDHVLALASEMRLAFTSQGAVQRLQAVSQPAQDLWIQLTIARYEAEDLKQFDKALTQLDSLKERIKRPTPESKLFDQVEAESALNLDDAPRAVNAYQRFVKVAPDNVGALNNLAYLLAENLNQPAKALPYAERAKTLARNDPQVLDTVGWVQYKAGHRDEALLTLRHSVELEKQADNCYHLAQLLIERGKIQEGRILLTDAEKLASRDARQDLLPLIRQMKENVRRRR